MDYDTSTINFNKLRTLPVFKCPPTYHLQSNPGNGCYLDPPGYPTYFTRTVFTRFGNTPGRGPETILFWRVVADNRDWKKGDTWDSVYERRKNLMRALYLPLPVNHPRVIAWIKHLFEYFRNCYQHPTETENGQPKTVIFPTPAYRLKSFIDDRRFSDEWRAAEKEKIRIENAEIIQADEQIAVPKNHKGVIHVRRIYPDWEPSPTLFTPTWDREGNWYERFSRRPEPHECPGEPGIGPHPVNGSWCQVCGWDVRKEKDK